MKMNNLSFGEGNLRSIPNKDFSYLTWSLPSRITCPYATEMCIKKCFAKKREVNFKTVLDSRLRNYEESLKEDFVSEVTTGITKYLARKKNQDRLVIIRIHNSGDFYSAAYLDKWIEIANHFKGNTAVMFQSYTKSVQFLKDKTLSDINIHFVYSVWPDTNPDDLALAREIGLPTFTAMSREDVEKARENGIYVCPKKTDGTCKECYKCNHKEIVVSYH